MEKFNKIVLNIPHDGIEETCGSWDGDIAPHITKWRDKFTSALFKPAGKLTNDSRVEYEVYRGNRFDCDVERLENDPLKKEGQGIYYTKFGDCTRKYDFNEHKQAMMSWLFHRYSLVRLLEENSLIIDCHSFPRDVNEDIDINIGFNEDFSKPSSEFITFLTGFFEGYRYKVGINTPYSNSITPTQELAYKSVMIELNKKIYLDENGKLRSWAYKINYMLNNLYKKILNIEI